MDREDAEFEEERKRLLAWNEEVGRRAEEIAQRIRAEAERQARSDTYYGTDTVTFLLERMWSLPAYGERQ